MTESTVVRLRAKPPFGKLRASKRPDDHEHDDGDDGDDEGDEDCGFSDVD